MTRRGWVQGGGGTRGSPPEGIGGRGYARADEHGRPLVSGYEEEGEGVAGGGAHRRGALLKVILAARGSETLETPAELEHTHAVLVARATEDLDISGLEAIGDALARLVGATLWTVRHRTVI